jgi:hypothetical protein
MAAATFELDFLLIFVEVKGVRTTASTTTDPLRRINGEEDRRTQFGLDGGEVLVAGEGLGIQIAKTYGRCTRGAEGRTLMVSRTPEDWREAETWSRRAAYPSMCSMGAGLAKCNGNWLRFCKASDDDDDDDDDDGIGYQTSTRHTQTGTSSSRR